MSKTSAFWADRVSILLLAVMFVIGALSYGTLPDSIPTHFNFKGIVDGFGPKYKIWVLPLLAVFTYLLLKISINFFQKASIETQRRWSSGYRGKSDKFIEEANAYNFVQMSYLNLTLVAILGNMFVGTMHAAHQETPSLNP